MEEEDNFYHLIRTTPFATHVKIGTEIKVPEMEDLSLITATYNIGEEQFGKIAILGPKRMNYGKVISLLNLLSKNLTFTLSNLYDE